MEQTHDKFEKFLKLKGLKMTHGREVVLEQVLRTKGHFDSESLFNALQKKNARVSRDAVFRTVPLILESGILQKSVGEGKAEYFEVVDPKGGHHDHMVCTQCGKVIEFFSRKLETAQEEVCEKYGFEMTFHDHRIFGICKNCQT